MHRQQQPSILVLVKWWSSMEQHWDFAMTNDTRSLKLRNVTAPYALVLVSVKVCSSIFTGSKSAEVYFLSIVMLDSWFMSFAMLNHSLFRSACKGSSHLIFNCHSFCIKSLEWIVTRVANPIGSKILDDSCSTSLLVVSSFVKSVPLRLEITDLLWHSNGFLEHCLKC